MAMQQMISAPSSSSSVASLKKYQVFISFRGEDTRHKFTSHFYNAMNKEAITFKDDMELKKGDEISSELIKAIEDSYASVVIFSKDYASSKWCLNELVKILECKKNHEQIVIPVFYEIDPSHVRNQTGSYQQAFEKHEQDLKHNKDNKLQKWKEALTEAAKLVGWNSENYRNESDFIKLIVDDVLKKLNHRHPYKVNKKLVGIEKKCEEVDSLMKIGSNDVRRIGLWGMGGIGKTTLAKELYAKHGPQFDHRCFLENIREESTRCIPNVLQNKLFPTLMERRLDAPDVERIFINKLAREKSFIVLDDVATVEQAVELDMINCLGPGSRVIVTARDKQICSHFDKCEIYEVEGLDKDHSLQLFCEYAFREKHVKAGYEKLSESAIYYCRGNPLALKVLGANFCTKSQEAWESELEKLKEIPNRNIHNVLKLSFDDLDRTEKDIFLDIACFFSGMRTNFDLKQRDNLTVLLKACNFFPTVGIEALLNKALITSNNIGTIEMHDLLVEMGKEIVKLESPPKVPEGRSRLWDPEEVYEVLKQHKGTKVVEVILFDISKFGNIHLSSDAFESMTNLRYLHINNEYTVHLPEGLAYLSNKLRYLCWPKFPLKYLPSTFCPQRLVRLRLTDSKLEKLWDGIQKLDNLMIIELDYSRDLIEIPDLSKAPNLKRVSLSYCVSLCELHPSIFNAPKLVDLCLSGCKKIESLKAEIHSTSLQRLNLTDCSSLVEFSVTSKEMTTCLLGGTAIRELLSSSIWVNSKLWRLDLKGCKNLNMVVNNLSNGPGLGSVTVLDLSGTQINTLSLSFILDAMRSLRTLYLRDCYNLEALPDNIQNHSMLERLYLDECKKLKSIPKLPASLKILTATNCTCLDTDFSIQQSMLIEKNLHIGYNPMLYFGDDYMISFVPGSQVPCKFKFQTTEPSILVPPIRKSGFRGFVYCIIIPKGLRFEPKRMFCTIYENGKHVHLFQCPLHFNDTPCTLKSDHVMLGNWEWFGEFGLGSESGDDYYNFIFEFPKCYYVDDEKEKKWSTKDIKGCGVIPIYESYESDELQHHTAGAEVKGSNDENEDDEQFLIPSKKRKMT